MRRTVLQPMVGLALLGVSAPSLAQDAGVPAQGALPSADTREAKLAAARAACVEHIPEGKMRPDLSESFPARGKAGYAALLKLELKHGKGETVLPGGFKLRLDSREGRALEASGFVIPAPEGPRGPSLTRKDGDADSVSTVELAFVPLPKEPGPATLILPSVPIALARASGEIFTLCTSPHELKVDDPTANTPHATPRDNPPPRSQREVWTAAKNVVLGALIALPVGALLAFLILRWLRRERPKPPPPPPRPPWEVALEALSDVRRDDLVGKGRASEHFAAVSFAVRRYLGDLYGFDGLESTTGEALGALTRASGGPHAMPRPTPEMFEQIERFLRRADLVKFANLSPTVAECAGALETGEQIVRKTMVERSSSLVSPLEQTPPEPPPPPPPAPGARS
ncbi:MAG: hypothetical protein ABW217_02430 [Polyangiaceae bacterium]